MSVAGLVVAAMMATASLPAQGSSSSARGCLLPNERLATARDTAAFCAEAFVERNGYTELPGTSDREMIAVEARDRGRTLTDAVEARRRTIARGAVIVCEGPNGFSVVFHVYDPLDSKSGHVVVMGRGYDEMRLLAGFTRTDVLDHGCVRL
ncbi:MAG: hypothetical protein H0U66_01075 [Gemmatimonadaceae bacterium]|nr:hypothetical protein [Gemmatimonadaceae bacterium]